MDSIVALPRLIVEWLGTQEDMSDLTFFVEYPPIKKAVPLRKSIVAVGVESIEIKDKFVDTDSDGVLERQEYCRLAEIRANLKICVPFDFGGQTCHDIFTRIADALTFRTDLNISESGCENVVSDRDTDSLIMNGWFLIQADFCPAQSTDENYVSFLDKELLCGSHIRNNDIHVTAGDKEKWNAYCVTGTYIGNGSASQTIRPGFAPKAVFVCATGYPPMKINFSGQTVKNYFGFACSGDGTQGVSVTSDGFRVSSATSGGATGALNEAATSYLYVAFR